MNVRLVAALCAALVCPGVAASAQELDSGPLMRVFLKNGQALASFGECAEVADRLVFTLVIGEATASPQLQLVSLPVALVDLDRTNRYDAAVRAARYASTRGESDYAAMTEDISSALQELTKTQDSKARLAIAEKARQRLTDWSKESHGYRAADGQELSNLFDQVIAELRAAAGESRFVVDLSMTASAASSEPLMRAPTARESLQLAMATAAATDDLVGREGILSAVVTAAAATEGADDLRLEASRRLADEHGADAAYASLKTDVLTQADAAARQGDVKALLALEETVKARDRALGSRRPDAVEAMLKGVDARLDAARTRRLALDHWLMLRSEMLAYERRVRPALSALDGLKPIIEDIRDMTGPGFEWLQRADEHLKTLVPLMKNMTVPPELSDVHATLTSAVNMAAEACARRRLAVAANDMPLAREASAAAAGALMLVAQGRQELLQRLYPPKIQ